MSISSLYQAKVIAKKFDCGNSCTPDMDGNRMCSK